MFKFLFASALVFASLSAHAVEFTCIGNTHDGRTVTVSGEYNKYTSRLAGPISIVRTDSSDASVFDTVNVPARNAHLTPTDDNFTVTATWGDVSVMIRHPRGTEGQSYMRVYLNDQFDHEFEHAMCDVDSEPGC